MLFNSFTFLIFFSVVLVLHWLPLPWRVKKLNLLLASYLFYAAWNPPFVLLVVFSTIVDWHVANWIRSSKNQTSKRIGLYISLGTNLGLLAFFKYGNFLLENFIALANSLGVDFQPATLDVILPMGISFYTFQTLSYTIDVYRGKTLPCKSFLDFALYVTFFPQLVAGPIVRSDDFLPQCESPRIATSTQFGWGISLLLLGLFEKMVIADAFLGPIAEKSFRTGATDFVISWTGTLAFSGQIFCDFAGYSTCAIGAAMCLGFSLPDNFRFPYAAIGFSDFWHRWHISLSTWLRDYLYIPLGGNRMGVTRMQLNLMLTMLIGGLWHGASWTFVVWGGLHGIYLIAERTLRQSRVANYPVWKSFVGRAFLALTTYFFVCIAWTFFRAESLNQAIDMIHVMLLPDAFSTSIDGGEKLVGKWDTLVTLVVTSCMLIVHWLMRDRSLEELIEHTRPIVIAIFNAAMLTAILMTPGESSAFIYFQF